ncbi:winged helix-turn-helix transcriptional regulator [Amycolatopsis benzoatilytica]|uniref:winged helix-turn-helix transcriptional regulator n=1 Tax=Amycolatopsis benzoatilytica TaxID=346045 RepID=UPI0003716A2D|nr:helix-turn-helix domain-containing protein [Amycolatopsis benzoatilytica]
MTHEADQSWDRVAWDIVPDSVALTLAALTPHSSGVIMREAFYGTRRFDDFLRRTGMSPGVLSARLRDLVAQGLLVKVPYKEPGARERAEYRLTDQGRDLVPTMIAMIGWADRWLTGDRGPTMSLRHSGCGAPVEAALKCGHGHENHAAREIVASPGPGARPLS